MTGFKSIYPEGWQEKIEKMKSRQNNESDRYLELGKKKTDLDFIYKPGQIRIAWTIMPEVMGQPNRMPTFGEMLKVWDHINEDLYKRIIELRYHQV